MNILSHARNYLILITLPALLLIGCGGGGGGSSAGPSGKTGTAAKTMFLGTPATEPAVIPPSANNTQVTFLSMVTGTALPPATLQLDEVDSNGAIIASGVAQLRDDGQQADLKRGDRIYTGTLNISSVSAAEKNYRVSTAFNGNTIFSNAMNFWVSGCPATSRPSDPAQAVYDGASNSQIFTNEVMIRTLVGVPPDLDAINAIAANVGGHVVGCIPTLRQYLLEITNPNTPADAAGVYASINSLVTQAGVETAFPNGQSLAEPLSPLTSSLLCDGTVNSNCQWYLDRVRAPQAWQLAGGGDPQMAVAMIDFGVDCALNGLPCDATLYNHDPIDHGTGVAGLIASPNNSTGMVGAAYNTHLYPYSFLGSAGSQYKMNELITTVLSQTDVRIINISAGTRADFDGQIKTAICHAISSGRLVVAAAGNPTGQDAASCELNNVYPAHYNSPGEQCENGADLQGGLLIVGASDINNNLASWSDGSQVYCSNQKYVNLYAPGKDIVTLSTVSGYTTKSGTSYAAPLVSGAAAVLWSAHPGDTPKLIHDQLINSAGRLDLSSSNPRLQTGDNRMAGKPLLDMYRAVGGIDTIASPDTIPNAFTITAVTRAPLQSDVDSAPFTVEGIDSPTPITIVGGYYSVNDGPFTNAAGSVQNGDSIKVQLHTPATATTTVIATLTVGGLSQTFSVTTRDPLNTPGSFVFPAQKGVSNGSIILSAPQTITGIDPGTAISISGGEYSIDGGTTFTSAPGTIGSGQTVQVRLTSPTDFASTTQATLTIGTVSSSFVVTTPVADTTPDAFTLGTLTNVAPATTVSSLPVTVSGLNTTAVISISAGEYSLNSGLSYTRATGSVSNGQTVLVRLTSSSASSGNVAATLTIGTVSSVFSVTTMALDTTPDSFSFNPQTNVTQGAVVTSNTITISGINTTVPISISGDSSGQYSLDSGVFTNAPGMISAGQTVTLRVTAPSASATAVTVTVTIGSASSNFSVSTTGADTTPDAFTFSPSSINDVPLNSVHTASTTITGINTNTPITISGDGGAQYSLDGGTTYTNSAGTVTNNQTVMVRLTAAAAPGITRTATLTAGNAGSNVSADFTVTTLPAHTVSALVQGPASGGSVSPAITDVVQGASTNITITLNSGYTVDVSGCGGVTVSSATSSFIYSTGAVTVDCTVNVTFNDVTPPLITLNGANPFSVNQGSVYVEPGATAIDNVDGVVSVSSSGTVDTSTLGGYTITYSAIDAAGNTTLQTRTVNVVPPPRPFITTWKTDNTGTTASNQIKIGTQGTGYDYSVNWGDGQTDTNVTGDIIHTYATAGTYTVSISGQFPQIYFSDTGYDNSKLLSVEQWGTNVWRSMHNAFYGCSNLVVNASDAPDLSQVTDMSSMFFNASAFNQAIDSWDVSNVTNMNSMFYGASAFNQPLNSWDVSNVTSIGAMFANAIVFNQPIGSWNVSKVTDMGLMFTNAYAFNQPIGAWNVSSVTNMGNMFFDAFVFNQPIGNWDVSKVTNMYAMFTAAYAFDQDISTWNVSSVTNMGNMFNGAMVFNQDISSWDVSNVTGMGYMFAATGAFNQPIGIWNVSKVTDMSYMFYAASVFNRDISGWNVSSVTYMDNMFTSAVTFNQPIGSWSVGSVTNMVNMFSGATAFNQDLSTWNVSAVTDMSGMFTGVTLSVANYDALLKGWSTLTLQSGVAFDAGNSRYSSTDTAVNTARNTMISTYGWTVSDGGPEFTFTVSGTVNGLVSGAVLTLQNNGTDTLLVTGDGSGNQPFTFATPISNYNVTSAIPFSANQICGVGNGRGGPVSADVTNVTVTCVTNTGNKYLAGHYTSFAIHPDGTLWAWGWNSSGQLGDGTTTNRTVPVQIGTDTHWASVAAGITYSVGLRTDGTLWTWGTDNNGVLGDGIATSLTVTSPKQIGTDTDWMNVSAGWDHTVALKMNHTLWAWGANDSGQLGDGNDSTTKTDPHLYEPTHIGSQTWAAVSAGQRYTVALQFSDNSLWTWGTNNYNQLGDGVDPLVEANVNTPKLINSGTWASVSAGTGSAYGDHTLAIDATGKLFAWGGGTWGEIGDGNKGSAGSTSYNVTAPKQIGVASNWVSVASGSDFSMAKRTDGSLWIWGFYGQLGTGNIGDGGVLYTAQTTPIQLGASSWNIISAGGHAMALATDNTLWAWGENFYGELGTGSLGGAQIIPEQIGTAATFAYHTIGGTMTGLTTCPLGCSVGLQLNATNNVGVSANGPFTFSMGLKEGASYGVTFLSTPSGQTCGITGETGVVGTTNVTGILVTCTTP